MKAKEYAGKLYSIRDDKKRIWFLNAKTSQVFIGGKNLNWSASGIMPEEHICEIEGYHFVTYHQARKLFPHLFPLSKTMKGVK